jgi:AcrR family transcriptional regulator
MANSEGPLRSVPRTARERARAEITAEIIEAGRRHLATDGAAGLSLRAIARELGMASSAVYRYMASRDELLTKLIIDAYDSLGAAAEAMEALRDRGDLFGRWSAVCEAVRSWAIANPNEYALIYGSPVPGYVAPADTVASASRVSNLLVQILIEAVARRGAAAGSDEGGPAADTDESKPVAGFESGSASGGRSGPDAGNGSGSDPGNVNWLGAGDSSWANTDDGSGSVPGDSNGPNTVDGGWAMPDAAHRALAPLRAHLPAEVPGPAVQAGLMVWAALFGIVSFELFGQFHNVVGESPGDREAFFAECVRRWAFQLGLG